jgi:hypothetical protein
MSITERMENDGLSFADAAAKESLAVGSGLTLLEALRSQAQQARAAMLDEKLPAEMRVPFAQLHTLFTGAAAHIEAQDKRFAEHLEAWKANNAHHAARIEELEEAVDLAMSIIDHNDYDTTTIAELRRRK